MARFYFDLQFGKAFYNDDSGQELSRPSEAFQQMAATMLEIGKEVVAKAGAPELIGTVRDETGVLWRGCLSLQVQNFRSPRRSVA